MQQETEVLGESIKWKASGMKSTKDHSIRSSSLCVEIWLDINGFQVVLLPSVLEEDIKAVKNAVVQLGGYKNPGRVNSGKYHLFQY